ncbi:MAG: hypothetical protein AAFO01_15180 [Pseudomonadota bacterium]
MMTNRPVIGSSLALRAGGVLASLLALSACETVPQQADTTSKPVALTANSDPKERIRSALGKLTLEAAAEGQEVMGVEMDGDRGLVNLRYSGPADRFITCDTAGWLLPDGGVTNVDLSESTAFETIDPKGDTVSIERWVRLDVLTNVVVRSNSQAMQVEPRSRYIVSMVTEVYDLNERIGHKAERLEFESGGSAVTSTGHRCKSTGVLEDLAVTAAS